MRHRVLAAAFLLTVLTFAQESATTLENPFSSGEDIARGERTFLSQCASCHGRDGRGTSAAPDLSTGQFRRASTDEGLYKIIGQGIPGTTMPAFSLNPAPAWQVVAYIRSLARHRSDAAKLGDAARGASLFNARCKGCHQATAPSLTGISSRRSINELRASILNPSQTVADAYWRIRATLKDGSTVTGTRLNEDTFTLQLRDAKGTLRSLDRSSIANLEYDRTSPMPPFQGKLSDAELNDILAFVISPDAP